MTLDNGDSLVASRFHRFWKAGRGWAMAKELKAGDVLRVLDGVSAVIKVEQAKVQPVYNLNVSHRASFFVGDRRPSFTTTRSPILVSSRSTNRPPTSALISPRSRDESSPIPLKRAK